MCLIFLHSPRASQHTWSTCPQACGCPLEKKLDLLFHCLPCHANWSPTPVFITDILSSVPPIYTLSPDQNNCLHTEPSFFCRFQKVSRPLTTKKRITLRCSSTVQVDSGAAMFYGLLRRLKLFDRHDLYMTYC